jgi:hypothetical protein
MTEAEAIRLIAEERAQVEQARAKYLAKNQAIEERYRAMLTEVEAWEPPTADHVELKQFMLDQLTESIRFDCSWAPPAPGPAPAPAEWIADRRRKALDELAHAAGDLAQEIQRAAGRTAWVKALRASLAEADAMPPAVDDEAAGVQP